MEQYKVHFEKTDIIFTDPCYFVKDDDIWDKYFEDFLRILLHSAKTHTGGNQNGRKNKSFCDYRATF